MKKIKDQFDFVRNETLAAYSDCNDLSVGDRNLKFKASFPVSGTALKAIMRGAVPDGYNDFDEKAVERLVELFGEEAHYVIAREGSVCIYVKPLKRVWVSRAIEIGKLADEVSYEGAGIFRVWWD